MNNNIANIVTETGLSAEKVEEILKAIKGVNFSYLPAEEDDEQEFREKSDRIYALHEEGVLDWDFYPESCGWDCCGSFVEKKIKGPKGEVTFE